MTTEPCSHDSAWLTVIGRERSANALAWVLVACNKCHTDFPITAATSTPADDALAEAVKALGKMVNNGPNQLMGTVSLFEVKKVLDALVNPTNDSNTEEA